MTLSARGLGIGDFLVGLLLIVLGVALTASYAIARSDREITPDRAELPK